MAMAMAMAMEAAVPAGEEEQRDVTRSWTGRTRGLSGSSAKERIRRRQASRKTGREARVWRVGVRVGIVV